MFSGGIVQAREEALGILRINGERMKRRVWEARQGERIPLCGGVHRAEEHTAAGAGEQHGGVGAVDSQNVDTAAVGS